MTLKKTTWSEKNAALVLPQIIFFLNQLFSYMNGWRECHWIFILVQKKELQVKKICAAPSTLGKAGILGVASWWSEQPSLRTFDYSVCLECWASISVFPQQQNGQTMWVLLSTGVEIDALLVSVVTHSACAVMNMTSLYSGLCDGNVPLIAGRQIKGFFWFVGSWEWIAGVQDVWSLSAAPQGWMTWPLWWSLSLLGLSI